MQTKWEKVEQTDQRETEIKALDAAQSGHYSFTRPMLEFLHNKGARTLEDIEQLTNNSVDMERNPLDLAGITQAVNRLESHVQNKSYVMVFGDYDTDGVCSTSVMVLALRNLGLTVDYFVNDRFVHGYGINKQAVQDMLAEAPRKPDVIVTVDNGIVAFEGVQYAVDQGIEVIITDHHIAQVDLPPATAVVNPHRLDDTSEFKEICGATVAYKVMLALYFQLGLDFDYVYDLRDLVALATVGDVMPIIDENRWFVTAGLELINQGKRPQFDVLRQVIQGDKPFTLNGDLFGFLLSPIMNAPGRLEGKPDKAIDFFLSEDENEMKVLAEQLVELNQKRKDVTAKQVELTESIVDVESHNVIVVYHEDFHEGIIGLIAGQLKEKYYKPAVVFADGPNGTLKGSARSIDSYHIKEGFDRVAQFIKGHGGHSGAAGLSIEKGNFEDFKSAIEKDAERLSPDDLKPVVTVDYVLDPTEITEDLIEEMEQLRPFGNGFEAPLFGMKSLEVSKVFFMTGGKHAKLVGKNNLTLLMFGGGEHVRDMGDIRIAQAVGSPSLNTYNGRTNVQFMVHRDCLIGK